MTILRDALKDLRDKRLWPVAAALLVALIGIPAFLSTTAASTPAPSIPPSEAPATNTAGIPVVSVNNAPEHSKLNGHARDPFKQQVARAASSTKTSNAATSTSNSSGAGSGGSTTTPTGSGTTPTGSTTPPLTTTTTTTAPSSTPTPPAPTGLTGTESYNVSLSITNAAGGVDAIPALERLSILPNRNDPLLVELGVLKGGKRVLFAVQPDAVLSGSGQCLPGPIDCQLVSIAPNHTESVTRPGATSTVQFAVTGIKAQQHGSRAAAARLRNRVSAAGRRLLASDSALSALSLFKYVPSLGAVLDLRNLSVGGN